MYIYSDKKLNNKCNFMDSHDVKRQINSVKYPLTIILGGLNGKDQSI